MATLKYKLIPEGAAEGRVPIILIFIDKKDVVANGLTYREACEVMAKNFKEPAAIDIMDMDAITVTSDGIVVDYAIVAFASKTSVSSALQSRDIQKNFLQKNHI